MGFSQFVLENKSNLQKDKITDITRNKIKYIMDYVDNWTYVIGSFNSCVRINFIDCMCNAGIYEDCTLCTSMEVLKIFISHAKKNPEKEFNLFLNDISAERIEVIKKLSKLINSENIENINIYYDNMDVNRYLNSMIRYKSKFEYGSCSILFVDPYNFGTVKVDLLRKFSNDFYSEIIFNYFSSDYRRNINNETAIMKMESIKESMAGVSGYNESMNDQEVLELIQNHFKTSKIKYSFAYQFRISTNVPLYSIVYATPHPKGLEKLKDSLWKIFNGQCYFKNSNQQEKGDKCQLSFFDEKVMNTDFCSEEAKNKLINQYKNECISYDEIATFILENTMLRKGQVLNNVIKPLIDENKIEKKNCNGLKNYLQDKYYIKGDYHE